MTQSEPPDRAVIAVAPDVVALTFNEPVAPLTLRLVARPSMPNYVAGEVARLLFTTKAQLVSTLPQMGQIEAPDTDKGAALPVHPDPDFSHDPALVVRDIVRRQYTATRRYGS